MYRSLKEKLIGDRQFYKMMLLIAVPVMIQNGITNFVGLLDNIMVGQVGTEPMTGVAIVNQLIFVYNLCIFGEFPVPEFLLRSIMDRRMMKVLPIQCVLSCGLECCLQESQF